MNAHVKAIEDALATTDGAEPVHVKLSQTAFLFKDRLDQVTRAVEKREQKYTKVRDLQAELTAATAALTSGDDDTEHRDISKIASELKRVNNSIDTDIDKVFELINEADEARNALISLVDSVRDLPLTANAV